LVAKVYCAAGQSDKAAAKLEDAAGLASETIESATKLLDNIRSMKSAIGGGGASEKVTKKPMKIDQ
jgi:hypothetical protein